MSGREIILRVNIILDEKVTGKKESGTTPVNLFLLPVPGETTSILRLTIKPAGNKS